VDRIWLKARFTEYTATQIIIFFVTKAVRGYADETPLTNAASCPPVENNRETPDPDGYRRLLSILYMRASRLISLFVSFRLLYFSLQQPKLDTFGSSDSLQNPDSPHARSLFGHLGHTIQRRIKRGRLLTGHAELVEVSLNCQKCPTSVVARRSRGGETRQKEI